MMLSAEAIRWVIGGDYASSTRYMPVTLSKERKSDFGAYYMDDMDELLKIYYRKYLPTYLWSR